MRRALDVLAVGLILSAATVASGQVYPNKPVRIVSPGLGGGNDFVARLVAQALTVSLGQPMVVENRASGVVPAEIVSRAPPDGYTLLCYGSPLWLLPLMQKVPYDAARDFSTITLAARAPNILVVHPGVAAKSVSELIALAKAKPELLNYAAGSTGAANHLAAELFKSMAGVSITRIPYESQAPAIADLLAGRVQMMFTTAVTADPHVKSGKLRALAVTSAQPSALVPGLIPISAAGLPGFEAVSFFGFFAPAGTPSTLVSRLNREMIGILNRPDVKQKLLSTGLEVVGSSPAEFAAIVKSEMVKMGKVIKDAGIRLD